MTIPLPGRPVEVASDPVEPRDHELVARILAGDAGAFARVVQRYDQRVFRAARAVLRDEAEAEDVVQETFVQAFRHLAAFEGRASLGTWLTKIAVHEALARVRRGRRLTSLEAVAVADGGARMVSPERGPEEGASGRELQRLLTAAVDALPAGLREVFVLRDVEGLSTLETAACLALSSEAVKVRLHRARRALRGQIDARLGGEARQLFAFGGHRCAAMVVRVLRALGLPEGAGPALGVEAR